MFLRAVGFGIVTAAVMALAAHLPATYGSHALAAAVASADAEVIRRLRRAGAVIVGLTRSHESVTRFRGACGFGA